MANKVDELIIQIKADTKQLKKELKQIEGKIKVTGATGGAAFGMGAAGLGGKLKKLAGPLAIGAVAVGMAKMTSVIAGVGSQFEDLKDSLDTVFGSIEAGDVAMQKVFDFAQKTPFQIETATKAFIALKSAGVEPSNRMMQVFADTASTSTDQLGVFEALVRTVQRSASGGLGLEELNMIMDRGIDVLGILNDELGLTKDEIAKFGATAEGAKLITDALINGLERKFGGAMETKMDNLSTKTSNMTIAFKQLADEVFKSGLGEFLGNMAVKMTSIANSISAAVAAMRGAGTGVVLGDDPFENIEKLAEKQRKVQAMIDRDTKLAKNKFAKAARDRIDTNNLILQQIEKEVDKQFDLLDAQSGFTESTKKLTNAEKENLFQKGQMMNSFTFLSAEIEKLKGNSDELSFASENLGEIFKQNEEAFAKLGINTLPELENKLSEIKNTSQDVAQTFGEALAPAIQSISLSFTNNFVNALLEGRNALDSFKDFAKNIVSQIISIFLQMAVVNKILNAIFHSSGMGLGGSEFTKLPELAGGGTIQGGKPTLVGERGPEIFVPNTGGTIMNNMNSKNAMGGGSTTIINQSINFATGVVPTVRAEVMKMMPQIADVTKGAVAEASMRGGNYRRMLQGG
jgi:hypothetical protein